MCAVSGLDRHVFDVPFFSPFCITPLDGCECPDLSPFVSLTSIKFAESWKKMHGARGEKKAKEAEA